MRDTLVFIHHINGDLVGGFAKVGAWATQKFSDAGKISSGFQVRKPVLERFWKKFVFTANGTPTSFLK